MADTFKHGIYIDELATRLTPVIAVPNPTVVIGTAPIHLASDPAPVNTPVLCQSFSEFVQHFGYSDDFNKYTACEAASCFFSLYNVSPLIVINVLDVATHKKQGTKNISGLSNPIEIDAPIILSTLTAKSGDTTLVADRDYTAAYNGDGKVLFTVLDQTKITGDSATLTYQEVDAGAITAADVIGGVDLTTGNNTGLECIEDCYPRLGLVPSTIIAPKFSTNSAVAAVMAAKCRDINGVFKAICAVDLDTSTVRKINDCNVAKSGQNFADSFQIVCWPKVSIGGVQYHLSTQIAALMNRVDSGNSDVPYQSPSNQRLQMDMACLADGTEINLSKSNANYLNGLGIATALNFAGMWRCWCVHTGAYPTSTDPLNFISVRRMMNWIANSIVVNFWSRVDLPINRRNASAIKESINLWLNGLRAREFIVAGECYLLEELNPVTQLTAGTIIYSLYVTPPPPAREITFQMEYNVEALSAIFR